MERHLTISMKSTLNALRRLLVLPFIQGPEEVLVGGQAVIEGVMMRSPHSWAVAVRKMSGSMAVLQEHLDRPSERRPWLRYPLVRGLGVLGQAMVLGIRALRYSAQEALDEEKSEAPANGAANPSKKKAELSNWLLALNVIFSLAFFIVFYKFLPLYAATLMQRHYAVMHNFIAFNFVDGVIRMILFLAFLFALAQMKEIKRVFEYHGAEHKVVWAFEKNGGRVNLENARKATRFHPRCGTSFLLVVMVIALIVYLFLPFQSFAWKLIVRILLLPVIAGVSYEFIRYAARSKGWVWHMASQPGLWLQRVTTREPDDRQLETAIRSLEAAMELEKQHGGELVIA
ncbi:MAG TPA: DUF1385 domain-containing protein [Terriglobia bacterium]|nr:DUF1385 domain-containing protein [Terriglobia bacterium]